MQEILELANFRIKMSGENLVIAIAQDHMTSEVLMVAFMNHSSFKKTLESRRMYYYSTSRKKIWQKGEESGHFQEVREVLIDCDGDALVFKVEQKGAACHKGYRSCFFRRLEGDRWVVEEKRVFRPEDVYKS